MLTGFFLSPKNYPYTGILDEKIKVKNEKEATKIYEKVINGKPVVSKIEKKTVNINPYAPFTTMPMIQSASTILGWGSSKTMKIAQSIYESGWITYMRTDSPHISKEAIGTIRQYIDDTYGSPYLPKTPKKYSAKKGAQEGHECCRPTDIFAKIKWDGSEDQEKLYQLI